MIYKKFDVDPINVDDNGIAENQTTGAAANLTLDGALCDLGTAGEFDIYDAGYSTGIGGVQIAIDSAGNISTVNFTVTGTDHNGSAATEVITGVTTTAVESTTFWRTITQIAADAAVGSNVFVGPVDEVCTPDVSVNWRNSNTGATVAVTGLSGTCQFDIEELFDDIQDTDVTRTYFVNQSNKSADLAATMTVQATAVRLRFDSYSSGAELQFHVRHN